MLIDLELELCQQVLIQSVLRCLDFAEKLHNFFFTSVCCLILLFGLFDDLISQLAISTHKLICHLLKLLLLCLELPLHILIPSLTFHDELSQVESRIDVSFLETAEGLMSRLKLDELRDVRLVLEWSWVLSIFH